MNAKTVLFISIGAICVIAVAVDQASSTRSHGIKANSDTHGFSDKVSYKYPVPNVEWKTIDGGALRLEEFKGKVVLLNFWATWCPYCEIEFPSMLELVKKFDDQVVLVAVSVDETESVIRAYIDELRRKNSIAVGDPRFIVAWDRNQDIVTDVFHTDHLPETIIISPEGLMVQKIVGEYEWKDKEMVEFISSLLTVKPTSA